MEYRFSRKHYCFWVLIHVVFVGVLESCLEEERLGLLSIKDYFKLNSGDENRRYTNEVLPSWTNDPVADCCSWEGVECNNATMVTQLRLFDLLPSMAGSQRVLNMSLFTPFKELLNLDLLLNGFTDLYQNYASELVGEIVQRLQVEFVTKTRPNIYEGSILNLMSGLDLSLNQLTGEIPEELGTLSSIHALNLSHNQFTGFIPTTFAKLKEIESLDLSHNKLSGEIPSELIGLNSLSYFSVAYNNLSGKLPNMDEQFQTFDNKSYEGNPFLCGPPLTQSCNIIRDVPQLAPSNTDASEEK